MSNLDQLINSQEAADRLGVDRSTFNRWAARGRVEPVLTLKGRTGTRLYDPSDIERLKAKRAAVCTEGAPSRSVMLGGDTT